MTKMPVGDQPCMKHRHGALWILVLLMVVSRAGAKELPLVPFPDSARVMVVGENLKVYGLPLMAYEFKTEKSLQETSDFYTSIWAREKIYSDADEPYIEHEVQGWKVLSRLERGHNITIQLKDIGINGTHVLVGVSPLPTLLSRRVENKLRIKIPILGGTGVSSVVESSDRGKKTEVYWLESNDSAEVFLDRYVRHHRESGENVSGYKLTLENGDRVLAGSFQANSERGTYRYDVISKNRNKTHATVIWSPL